MQDKPTITSLTSIQLAKILWDYNKVSDDFTPCDLLFVLGSNDIRIAEYSAELYHQGYAKQILVSGGIAHLHDLLATGWNESEAAVFSRKMTELNVPDDIILKEDKATNTGENLKFGRRLCEAKGLEVSSGLLVHKPASQRRAIAVARHLWPQVQWQIASPKLELEDYVSAFGEEDILNLLTGETCRIVHYHKLGFISYQEMSDYVYEAMQEMIFRGYNRHLPRNLSSMTRR